MVSFGFACVHSGAPRVLRIDSVSRGLTRAHLAVVGFIQVCVGSLGRAKGSSGSFGFAWVHLRAFSGRRVSSEWLGFTRARLEFVGVIGVRVGLLVRA